MRITNNMLINNMINYIGKNLVRMEKYQYQLATGKKIQVPSDDPVVAARALKLRTDVAEIEQYKRNAEDALSWLEMTEDALAKIGEIFQRARELATQAANGTNTPDDLEKISEEINQLKIQLVHLSNSTYAGRYIFSGYKTNQKLINDDESDPNFGRFLIDVGNSENIKYEIGIGDDIVVNVAGGDLFNNGSDATAMGTSKFVQDFDDFLSYLQAGDHQAISGMLSKFDENMNNLLRVRADVGARINRIELTLNRLENDAINFIKLMSINEDVDQAETIMYLKNEENVYRASLAGGARIIMPTLVDFLR
ncbi:MAG TPA: flagellar hook-associated protein FlgL [Clostridiaceae bacterium]|nr:flagellar hook-associated protein FlgL [Clostridiaceae bacterium]